MDARFTGPIRDLLAKRASWYCSNPACGILTVGPTADETTASNLGEAAHIYGARPGSARYRDEMTDPARADVSNGIWLCCTCHKHADDDPLAHPAELLFEWRRQHELAMGMQLGQRLAAKVQDRALAAYPEAGYLAEQIILDRPAGTRWPRPTASSIPTSSGCTPSAPAAIRSKCKVRAIRCMSPIRKKWRH